MMSDMEKRIRAVTERIIRSLPNKEGDAYHFTCDLESIALGLEKQIAALAEQPSAKQMERKARAFDWLENSNFVDETIYRGEPQGRLLEAVEAAMRQENKND